MSIPSGQADASASATFFGLIIDAYIETELVDDIVNLFLRAGGAYDVAAHDFCNLADDLPDGARSCRYNDRVSWRRIAHIQEAKIRGHAGHPEDAERCRKGAERGVDTPQVASVRYSVLLPAKPTFDNLAYGCKQEYEIQ